jgi:AraC family transcriptional regulator
MYFVLEGSLTEFYRDAKQEYVSTSVIFTPPGERHSNLFGNRGGRCFMVEIPIGYIDRLGAAGVQLDSSLSANGGNLVWIGRRLYSEFAQPDSVSALSVDGLMLEALAVFARLRTRPERVPPQWLRQARELVRDRFAERLSLDEIATTAGIHPAHLARSFRSYFGTSIGEYQRSLRLEYASKQLADTRTPILTIALAAGFADQAHMSRIFRNHTGLTPARFRAEFGRDKQNR